MNTKITTYQKNKKTASRRPLPQYNIQPQNNQKIFIFIFTFYNSPMTFP